MKFQKTAFIFFILIILLVAGCKTVEETNTTSDAQVNQETPTDNPEPQTNLPVNEGLGEPREDDATAASVPVQNNLPVNEGLGEPREDDASAASVPVQSTLPLDEE